MHLIKQITENREQRMVKKDDGFTLIEMILVIAIFGIMTAIVVFNYSDFSNQVVLTNMAYEVALTAREAQVYGIASTRRETKAAFDNNDTNIGLNFNINNVDDKTQSYILYEDKDGDGGFDQNEIIGEPYTLQRNIYITALDVGNNCNVSDEEVNVIFDRPNPEPKINGNQSVFRITLQPDGSSNKRFVILKKNGQIYVTSDPESC